MSIFRVDKENVSSFTVLTNPHRTYVSSSLGATGSIHVFPRASVASKDLLPAPAYIDSKHSESNIDAVYTSLKNSVKDQYIRSNGASRDVSAGIETYMSAVNAQVPSVKSSKVLDVIRFTPTFSFTSNTMRKAVVKDILGTYYRTKYPSSQWNYTNYHSLCFFTSSTVRGDSALLYPNR